jgi:hypothetical protein
MAISRKYEVQLSEEAGSWTAVVVRKVSRTKMLETMTKDGFASEEKASAWGESEIDALLKKKNERTSQKRRARELEEARLEKARQEREEAYANRLDYGDDNVDG